jgi:GMP synthase (glutamine-hydrolysing)
MKSHPRYLLLQARQAADVMREQEVACFAWALDCTPDRIDVVDLLAGGVSQQQLAASDVVLIGGSGDYSVTADSPWLHRALDLIRELHQQSKPMFGSCWGFQALARALGGTVIRDPACAELGVAEVRLTELGMEDPIFSPLGERFAVFMGHEDRVLRLPEDAMELASTDRVPCQAMRFIHKPIYAAQFHVELHRTAFMQRVVSYPRYVQQITGMEIEEFLRHCPEIPEIRAALQRFVDYVLA